MASLRVLIVSVAFAFGACAMEVIDIESPPDQVASCDETTSAAGPDRSAPSPGAVEAREHGSEQPAGCEDSGDTEDTQFTCPVGQQLCVDFCCPRGMLCCPDFNGFLTCMSPGLC